MPLLLVSFLLSVQAFIAPVAAAQEKPAPKPLFRDAKYDGAADPVIIWDRADQSWLMFYTNRRANVPGLSGVAWVHGTPIGLARSRDGGTTWEQAGSARIALPREVGGETPTLWAPDVIAHDGTYHMFLTVVPGIFEDWQHPRLIVHLTSANLVDWKYESTLPLGSDRVIDACVSPLPDGGAEGDSARGWRLWYNNERDRKSIYYADSPDLRIWTDRGKAAGVGERPGEGPYVFTWQAHRWMIVDLWRGLGVYRSDDFLHWMPQPDNLLGVPGKGTDDGVNGGHACVVVSGDRAFLFYFTHPGRNGTISPADKDSLDLRRSSIQAVELHYANGQLSCDRDTPTYVRLLTPRG